MTRLGTASDDACLQLARSLAFAGQPIEARVDGRRVRIGTEAFCRVRTLMIVGLQRLGPGPSTLTRRDYSRLASFLSVKSLKRNIL
jgi:hypothetical protein